MAQKPSFAARLREKFKKKEEKPATKEEVDQLRLNAQREQYKYMHKNYVSKSKELKGGGGWQSLFTSSPQPRRGGGTGSKDLGFFSGSGDSMMGGEGAFNAFGAGPKPKGRGKQGDDWGGLKDMF